MLSDYTLEELQQMTLHILRKEWKTAGDHAVVDAYHNRRAAKYAFLDLYDGVEDE